MSPAALRIRRCSETVDWATGNASTKSPHRQRRSRSRCRICTRTGCASALHRLLSSSLTAFGFTAPTLLLSSIADRQYKPRRGIVKLLGSPPSLWYGDRARLVHRLHLLHETEEALGQGRMDVNRSLEHGVGQVGEHQRTQNLHQLSSLCSQDRGPQDTVG